MRLLPPYAPFLLLWAGGCLPDADEAPHRDTLASVAIVEGGADESAVADESPRPSPGPAPEPDPDATRTATERPSSALIDRDPVAYLRQLDLRIPVAGTTRDALPPSSFGDARGERRHEAYDIHAPRGTPVLAATDGELAKLHVSEAGGNMVYTYDASGRFVLFYAHLDRYHQGLVEGMAIGRGDTLGYVGTTGNAPATVPHLHFAIMLMDEDRRWWKGTPIDPQPLLAGDRP